ncbi:pentatricopeptide repeat-containing protein At5g42450, mitochondrial [Macadamia integrifolia]|uniref:pentatricopeptide repeat-containing protein At5g42450, mitochondrial n=1 Tax=Macadamia integrifolia TaxID=60698 RepID=UPI001C4FFB1C|nr:pentatricopeptide repeat-containing protein At5g42450, mitochondrial [Macadamia integrifolia]
MKSILGKVYPFQLGFRAHTLASGHFIEAQKAHAHLVKLGIPAVESDLVTSYCEAEAFSNARQVFEETSAWNLVSVTAIIGHFARHGRQKEAIGIFSRMLILNIRPNEYAFAILIHSSVAVKNLHTGRQLHACAAKMGLQSNVFVGSSLVDTYAKLSSIEEAQRAFRDTNNPNVVSYTTLICGFLRNERLEAALRLFEEMPERNIVSWNAMIGGCSQMGHNEEAVNLFIEMHREGWKLNESTFPCVFSAAANIAALGMGMSFHACAIKTLTKHDDVFVGNSLISFYAKCGNMEDSLLAFDRIPERNVVSWNAVICGFAQNGRGKEALESYQRMKMSGVRPNSVTLLCVLWACNHSGLVEEGITYFNQARTEDPYALTPEHYACMVDLLSRSGLFSEAERFLQELPFDPGVGFWKALLGGCQKHSNMELGELAARQILALDPEDVSSYVLLSNAHSAAGRWQSVSMIRKEMKEKGMKRIPGCSWIEVKNRVHIFVTGDRRHNKMDEIYMVLRSYSEQLKENPEFSFLKDH